MCIIDLILVQMKDWYIHRLHCNQVPPKPDPDSENLNEVILLSQYSVHFTAVFKILEQITNSFSHPISFFPMQFPLSGGMN